MRINSKATSFSHTTACAWPEIRLANCRAWPKRRRRVGHVGRRAKTLSSRELVWCRCLRSLGGLVVANTIWICVIRIIGIRIRVEAPVDYDHWGICLNHIVLTVPGRVVRCLFRELRSHITIKRLRPWVHKFRVVLVEYFP